MSLDAALQASLADQPFAYSIKNKTIIIFAKDRPAKEEFKTQQQKVTGKITDEKGQPVIGATVKVKSGGQGAVTDVNGVFTIDVSENSILIISYIGYETQEVSVTGSSPLNVSLKPAAKNLNDVVVIGYGTQRKRDVTGAVTSVSSETLQQVPAQTNVVGQLQGRVAGLDISTTGNAPGSTGQIRLRGERSFATSNSAADATNAPLFVLDGVPFINASLNDINPNDILSVEVLKDASATAIYGSRASGGVILVTTKRGKSGRTQVNFNTTTGITRAIGKYNLMDAQEYDAFKQETIAGNTVNPGTTPYPRTVAEQAGLDNGTNTDWIATVLRPGYVTDNQLRISGGTENTQFSLSGGYRDEKGIQYVQHYKRGSILFSLDQKISKVFKVGITSNNSLAFRDNIGDLVATASTLSPLNTVYNADGSINVRPATGTLGELTTLNPITLRDPAIQAVNRRLTTNNVLYGEANILDGLKYRLNASLSFNQSQGNNYNPVNNVVNTNSTQDQSTASISNSENYVWLIENILTYDKTFNQKHHFTFTGLYSAEKDHTQGSGINAIGVSADYLKSYNLFLTSSTNVTNSNFSYAERGLISYMARAFYGFDNKYLLTATLRRDGSSVLGPGHQYFTYPAFAFGWNVDQENFMKKVTWVNSLKFRLGYGVTADQNISPYQILGNLTSVAYNFGTNLQNGVLVTSLPNPNLKFEHTNNINLGVDFGLFNNRLTGSVDVYTQRTYDILQVLSLPLSIGPSTTTVNAGDSKGRGLEITLSSKNLTKNFQWNTDFNISFQRSEITTLHDGLQQDIGNGWFVGQPFNIIYDYKKLGIWQTSETTEAARYNQRPGQIKVQDVNSDGKIDASDRQILGNYQPKFIAGLTNHFSYKGFDLTAVAFGRIGQKVSVNYLAQTYGGLFNIGRGNQIMLDYWTPTNPTNESPRPNAGAAPLYASTLQYRDGSFIKMRSISLGYNFPKSILKEGAIKSLKVTAIVNNPFTIWAPLVNKGLAFDPESNGYGGQDSGASGFSGNALGRALTIGLYIPQTRVWSIGINAGF
ncbi:TonB-dependent receptor [Mucilaginibacter sp. PAMB04274]|uniref:SusC/RagA family TonB-linked outer membrane protein n=1 Tax=Mucilaginibacter sp. PAMB04274 TaxID=3138568 RepID=UPI0031F61AAA